MAVHRPVMVDEVVELLEPALRQPGAVLVDGTVGLGGHTAALLAACPSATAVGIDRDSDALRIARERLAGFAGRIRLVHAVSDELAAICDRLETDQVHAVLLDLGVSSMQLDEPHRGFAYRFDAPLDMRMDRTAGRTAADFLGAASVEELADVLRRYGEERYARRIAKAVVRQRERAPISSSAQLVELVRRAVPASRHAGHPAKRTFQALRIEVNDELGALARVVPAAVSRLAIGGRIVVLSYHSLEDRIVKQALAAGARSSSPLDLPVELPEHAPQLRLLTRGAQMPSPREVESNPRAASARLRAAERIRQHASAA
ncbi:MAG: 16S rRNA (cytosine(1402)-N(4))-methyltransferase RsmH [Angustibacter sp.]